MGSEYGLTAAGFRRKRLPDIIKSLNDRVSDALGVQIRTEAGSVFGQLHGVYAYELADLWEQAEQIYNAMYPSTATGTSLSSAAGLAGISLIEAEATTLVATCYGTEGTEIPYNAQITDGINIYSCTDVYAQITASRASVVSISIKGLTAGEYSLTIDDTTQTYTATESDTATTILVGLASQFSFDDRTLSTVNDVLTIGMADESKTMSITVSNNLQITQLASPFNFICSTLGAITPAIGAVNQIVDSVGGWTDVMNNVKAATGRNAESDTSLRQRWSASVFRRASAMIESIKAALLDVDGVTVANVYENNTNEVDSDGRPPHSIEAVVAGGSPDDIGKAIWMHKAGGIDTFGSQSVSINDSQGVSHTMNFNRPLEVPLSLSVTVTSNAEHSLSSASENLIKKAAVAHAAGLEVGQDVILQGFIAPIMAATSNAIGYITVQASRDGEAMSTDNIIIDSRHIATLSYDDVTVTINA